LKPDISSAGIEQTAPQVLIYGWMLQYGFALLPYLLRKAVAPQQATELGGSWLSLVTAHAGGVFLGASILIPDLNAPLLGIAYLLWFISLLLIVRQSWQILVSGFDLTVSQSWHAASSMSNSTGSTPQPKENLLVLLTKCVSVISDSPEVLCY
jgi:hypothetical protein